MKKILLSTLLLSAAPALLASGKLDAPAALRLEGSVMASMPAARSGEVVALPAPAMDEKAVYAVEMADEASAQALADEYDVIFVIDEMAMVSLDAEELQKLVDNPASKRISLGGENKLHLTDARFETGVDYIHEGDDLEQAYTGENVIVGMMDTGLDINHINFLKDDGTPRAERLWVLIGSNGSVQTYSTPDAIKKFTVDTSSGTHGTHVLGIMGGGYKGRLKQASINPRTGRPQVLTGNNMYYGVATDAILAPCCGTLDGNNVTIAAERIRNFAAEKGMPAVMNLSLGHNYGPHDGTTASNKLLAKMGEDMIICISAGNEGETNISLHKDFSAASSSVKTFVSNSATANGLVDIWGSDASQLKFTFVAVDKTTGGVVFSYDIDSPTNGNHYLTGSGYTAPDYHHDAKFDALFGSRSAIVVRGGVDSSNNRYNIYFNAQLSAGSEGANIVPGIIVEGAAGKGVDLYCSGELSMMSNGIAGYSNGNAEQSINDMACGDNVISVGAYVNIERWPTIDSGELYFPNVVKGSIASFSSYGKRFGGEQLPFICGPGMGMRSSYSYRYLEVNPNENKYYVADLDKNGRQNRWMEMSGTSMSSPFVAGVCALWLQANPALTVNDIKEAMKATARQDEFTAQHPERWGVGKIDAYEGLKYVLNIASVGNVSAENEILIKANGNGYEVFSPVGSVRAELYNLAGSTVASESVSGNTLTISTDNVAPGIYVLRATSGSQVKTRKVTVR